MPTKLSREEVPTISTAHNTPTSRRAGTQDFKAKQQGLCKVTPLDNSFAASASAPISQPSV